MIKAAASLELISSGLWTKWSGWLKLLIILALMISAGRFYGFYSSQPQLHTHYYQLLGDAFLSGHTDIVPYKLWDVAHYKDKYYLYFGPVPALLLWIPVKLITGIGMGDAGINWIMMVAGTCCLFLLLYLMALRQPFASIPGLWIGFLAIGFSKWMIPELHGSIYVAAIISAYGFTAMGILCLWMYLNNKEKYVWIAASSLCFGLAMGSRITYIFTIIFLLMAFIYLWHKEKWKGSTFILNTACTFSPFAMCLAGLAAYNYARFGSVFEIGAHYQCYGYNCYRYLHPTFQFFRPDLHFMLLHAYYYLVAPSWKPDMPPEFFGSPQKLSSLWLNNPFSWLFLFCLVDRQSIKNWKHELTLIGGGIVAFALLQLTLLSSYFNISGGYEADFAPWMMFVACVYYLHVLQEYRDSRLYWLLVALGGISAAAGILPGATSQSLIL